MIRTTKQRYNVEFSVRIDPFETLHPFGDCRACGNEEVGCKILSMGLRFRLGDKVEPPERFGSLGIVVCPGGVANSIWV